MDADQTHWQHAFRMAGVPLRRILTLSPCHLATLSLLAASVAQAQEPRETAVGMRGRIEQLVVPGSELEVKPLDDPRTPVVLRIVAVYPHGTAHRYDLEYWSLEPGTFDLRDYLRRKDGSTMENVPALRVEFASVLPAGQVLPNKLESRSSPRRRSNAYDAPPGRT